MFDLIIIGGGPAAIAAGVYAARKKLNTVLISPDFGGQSSVSADVENYIGIKHISGLELAKKLEDHIRSYSNEIKIVQEKVVGLKKINGDFEAKTDKGGKFQGKAVIIASGSRRRRLNIPGEDKFEGKGVAYCATCDAPLFGGKEVAVIGGGNAGMESTEQLLKYADKIYILEFSEEFRADPATIERIFKDPKINPITNAQTLEIKGGKFVESLVYLDRKTNEKKELKVEGVFVEIGSMPNSDFVKGLVELNKIGEIVVDPKTQQSSVPGIYAAGDVSDVLYKQNNISIGDGVKALESVYLYLKSNIKY